MTRSERIQSILIDALDLPSEEQERFVREASNGDTDIAEEVLSLLRLECIAGGEHDPFSTERARADLEALDQMFEEDTPLPGGADLAGQTIAQFELIRELGRGGMGVVYEAHQERPSRRVALKVLAGFGSIRSVRRRLELEAEVLGRLRHPGIAQVYEAGVAGTAARPQPYFAMELIDGLPLNDYAISQGLSTRDRLILITRIADAVEHAHQRGVIHRDLKPANILVTEEGQPKILDFGIARVADSDVRTTTLQTRAGALIGTLAYMSPEQASGDPDELDTRSDVYALGILTYELLAGSLPYMVDGIKIHEAITTIREADPAKLSSVDRSMRGDVETIVGKALEKDKDRRYQTAAEFAADVRRYLADEPIQAVPPGTWYQISKFAKRNKPLVAAAGAIGLGLTAATVLSITFAVRAESARVETQAALDDLEIVSGYQSGQLSLLDAEQMGIRFANSLRDGRERALTNAGETPERIAAELEELSAELVGVNFTDIARVSLQENIFAVAADDIETRFADRPLIASDLLAGLAETMFELGLGTDGAKTRDRAVAIRAAHIGETHPETVALEMIGVLPGIRGERFASVERVYTILSEALPPEDERVLTAQMQLAVSLAMTGDERAVTLAAEAVETATRAYHPGAEITLRARHRYLDNLALLGRPPSIAEFRTLLADARRALGDQHQLVDYLRNTTHRRLYRAGAFEEALGLVESILENRSRRLGATHRLTIETRSERASVLEELGLLDQAATEFERIIELKEQYYDKAGMGTTIERHNLGFIRFRQGRYDEAEALLAESLVMRRELSTYAGKSYDVLDVLWHQRNLAMVRVRMGKLDTGEALARDTLDEIMVALPGNWVIGHTRGVIGVALTARGFFTEAERELKISYDEIRAGLGSEHEKTRRVAGFLVELYDAWHTAEPDAGHDANAAVWRARQDPKG